MTLADKIKLFISNYLMTTDHQHFGGYEDHLENVIEELFYLCTTDEERAIVRAIISLEEHQKLNASDEHTTKWCVDQDY